MTNSNKVLTVSYGAFSCTLEGFDDSFSAMKDIAEYFRDLAADDRYFGADPPQPDAEVLARIAQKDISRRIEARSNDGHVVLKTKPEEEKEPDSLDVPPEPDAVPQPEVVNADQDVNKADPSRHTSPQINEAVVAEPAPAAELEDAKQENVEEKFSETAAFQLADAFPFLTRSKPEILVSAKTNSADSSIEPTSPTLMPNTSFSVTSNAWKAEDMPRPQATASTENLADRLQRIRAVVPSPEPEKKIECSELPLQLKEFENAAIGVAEQARDADDTEIKALVDIAEMPEQEDEISSDFANTNYTGADKSISETVQPRLENIASSAEHPKDAKIDRAEDKQAANDGTPDKTSTLDPNPQQDSSDQDNLPVSDDSKQHSDETSELSAEDEAELQRALAELEGESAPTSEPAKPRETPAELDKDADADISRLMAEADHQMQDVGGQTRRRTFSHLRAAVAALSADHSIKTDDTTVKESAKAYRSDLDEAVKLQHPVAPKTISNRPNEVAPAPLKLVAEQRVDSGKQASRPGPVAPRRVAATDDDSDEEGGGFAAYAQDRGAETLTDVLEAAAAFLSFVEGHRQFSRLQLMARVRQTDFNGFSREEGLMSFGQLLRSGKLEKIKGGGFTVSDSISYKPNQPAAGNHCSL